MEVAFETAIVRHEAHDLGDEYAGAAWDFRWGKDNQIYHWHEFKNFYKHNADVEWSFAAQVTNSVGSFIAHAF